MKRTLKIFKAMLVFGMVLGLGACQKEKRPSLGDYPPDANPPGGPLKFYAAFDGTSADPLRNAVDSIRANFASENLATTIDGVSGKGIDIAAGKFVRYTAANDWAKSTSFTIAFWEKHDGVPPNEAQFAFSIPSTAGHWSGGSMFLIFDHTGAGATNDLAVIKLMIADKNGEKWFELVGADRMPDIYDNQWHHLAFAYDEATSDMKIYRDGQLFRTISWTGHGAIELPTDKLSSFLVGGKCVSGWGESWIGGMDQFRLYGVALSDAAIAELFNGRR